jgi:RNA polymerase sigma-70 factor (ECF subfamily)
MARRDPTSPFPFPLDGAGAPAPGADDLAAAFRAHGARMRRAALRITRDPAAAEDAVQSALEKALRHRAAFRGEAQPSTWLHRIVVNEALAWRRGEGRRARHTLAAHEAGAAAARASGLPLDALLLRERREEVLRALGRLRADERDLLARFALDGSYDAWARGAGMKATAAKTRAFRARRALRAALTEDGA